MNINPVALIILNNLYYGIRNKDGTTKTQQQNRKSMNSVLSGQNGLKCVDKQEKVPKDTILKILLK